MFATLERRVTTWRQGKSLSTAGETVGKVSDFGDEMRAKTKSSASIRPRIATKISAGLLSFDILRRSPKVYAQRITDAAKIKFEAFASDEDVRLDKRTPIAPPEERVASLRRIGQALSSGEMVAGRVVTTAYSREALAVDLLAVLRYHYARKGGMRGFLHLLMTICRNVLYVIPGYGRSEIRAARYAPELIDPLDEISLSDFGKTLARQAAKLVECPSNIAPSERAKLTATVANLEGDSCAEIPSRIEEQIDRLQAYIGTVTMPRSKVRIITGYGIIVLTMLLAALATPWNAIADKSTLSGVSDLTVSLFLLLIGTSSLCAVIAHTVLSSLNEEAMTTVKTLAKATTVILAIATLLFGAGVSVGKQGGIGMMPGLLLYIMILLSTLSADNLVLRSEVRLKQLTARRSTS